MSRRKKSPPTAVVEAIVWDDAYRTMREPLDIAPVRQHTVGFVVHEDDKQVILAHELTASDDWMGEDMDYTKVPKALILQRVKIAEVTVAMEELDVRKETEGA